MRQNFWSALWRGHVLKRRNPSASESNHLARIRDTWWEPRIRKGIVQRRPEIFVQRLKRIVRIRGIINVNPRLRRAAAHVAHNFAIRRTPRQPHRSSRHADANLSLTYQRLIPLWKTLVKVWMVRNSRLWRWTTGENERACRDSRRHRARERATLHAASKSYRPLSWQAKLELLRSEISEEHNSAVGEGDASGRVHELWRDIRPVEWSIRVRSAVTGRCFVA